MPRTKRNTKKTQSKVKAIVSPNNKRLKGGSVDIDVYELPRTYNTTKITLVSRSPHSVYAYWDISSDSLKQLKKKLGKYFKEAKYYLRVYETSYKNTKISKKSKSFDVKINPKHNKQYIDLPKDNTLYYADLACKSEQGDFQTIAQSNPVFAQRSGSAHNRTLDWVSVNDNDPSEVTTYTHKKYQKYTQDFSRHAEQKPLSLYGGRVPLTAAEIWAYYSKLTPLLKKVHVKKVKDDLKEVPPVDQDKPLEPPQTPQQKTFSADQQPAVLIDDKKLSQIFEVSSHERMASAQSSDFTQPSPESGASDQVGGQRSRKFFFELNTELIVYGRTEPDATVTHGDKEIALNPDGTFSLRFYLPDGNIPLNFTARSFDKLEQRSINTAVERFRTMYVPG